MREFSGCFKEVSRVFHKSFMEEEASRMFQESLKGISRKFKGCFKVISRVL